MDVLDEAGLLHAVREAMLGFQYKNGFAFSWGDRYTSFNFLDKFSVGHNSAFNVQRADFDKLLIDEAEKRGVAVRYGETVKRFDNEGDTVMLAVEREDGETYEMETRFVLDASGFYRALPRLMNWELPPQTVIRQVHFTHIDDRITSPKFDRNKNLVCIHPEHRDIWVWLIPFANGRSSIGVVGEERYFRHESTASILKGIVAEIPFLAEILADAEWDNGFPFRYLPGYTTKGKGLYGRHFALLGASGEFLDPVFSSGVTIAVQSAKLAAACVAKELRGQRPDWKTSSPCPDERRNRLRQLHPGLVRRPLPRPRVRRGQKQRHRPHGLRHPRRLRLGQRKPLRARIADIVRIGRLKKQPPKRQEPSETETFSDASRFLSDSAIHIVKQRKNSL